MGLGAPGRKTKSFWLSGWEAGCERDERQDDSAAQGLPVFLGRLPGVLRAPGAGVRLPTKSSLSTFGVPRKGLLPESSMLYEGL